MKTLYTIHHKKNELQEVEFFEDAECTVLFDFNGKKNLYLLLKDGDITPLIALDKLFGDKYTGKGNIYTPFVNYRNHIKLYNGIYIDLQDITPNLSKYIPEHNAVLFLSEEDLIENRDKTYPREHGYMHGDILQYLTVGSHSCKKITIFLPHGTQSEIQKAEEVGKYLWKNFGIKPDVFALHCFDGNLQNYTGEICAIKFKNDICFAKYKCTDINIAMAEIEANLHEYLYTYNVTKSEGVISRFEEFSEDSLESYAKLEELRMQYGEDFTIIPNHIKTKALDDIKKSLQRYKTDLETHNNSQLKYSKRKSYFLEDLYFYKEGIFNKIITTNSTGILSVQDTERLQVIDCKEIFEEYLKENN